jgi:hypothetical protein
MLILGGLQWNVGTDAAFALGPRKTSIEFAGLVV